MVLFRFMPYYAALGIVVKVTFAEMLLYISDAWF